MFAKRTLTIPDGQGGTVDLPIVQIGLTERTIIELADGRKRPQHFAEVISLREHNPRGPLAGQPPYLQMGYENLFFTSPRFDEVEGLDYEVDQSTGEKLVITAERLVALAKASRNALVAASAARAPQVVSLDGDE